MKVILWIWQILQNIAGLILVKITAAEKRTREIDDQIYTFWIATRVNEGWTGVSLGDYVVFSSEEQVDTDSIKHEHGHQLQSLYSGPLYLILVGLPSALGNLYDRKFHKDWYYEDRIYWYYTELPWECSADSLGKVERFK